MGGLIFLIVRACGSSQAHWLVSQWTLAWDMLGQRFLAGLRADRVFFSY